MNLAGPRSAQPVPASSWPPRAVHRPAAARAPRTTPGGVHLRPRHSAPPMAEDLAVRPPDDGQAGNSWVCDVDSDWFESRAFLLVITLGSA